MFIAAQWVFFFAGCIGLPITLVRRFRRGAVFLSPTDTRWVFRTAQQSLGFARTCLNPLLFLTYLTLPFISHGEPHLDGSVVTCFALACHAVLRLLQGALRRGSDHSVKCLQESGSNWLFEVASPLCKNYVRSRRDSVVVVGVVRGGNTEIISCTNGVRTNDGAVGKLLYEIGSITKVFTAGVLASLAADGRVRLNDSVRLYIPDAIPPNHPAGDITLEQLATHSSGLPRLGIRGLFVSSDNPYRNFGHGALYSFLRRLKDVRPSQNGRYSNVGMDLLAHVLSKAAETSFEELIESYICNPAQMTDTRYALPKDARTRLTCGHTAEGLPASNWQFPLGGAGGLYSTVDDLLRFIRVNLGDGPPALVDALQACHIPRIPMSGTKYSVGLNWMSAMEDGVWHNGGTGGYRSFIGLSVSKQCGVVILSNYAADVDAIGVRVLRELIVQS